MGGEVAPAICAYLVGQGSRQMGKMVAAIAEHGMPESEGKLYRWLLDRHQSLAKWRHLLAHGCICQSPNYTDALMVGTSESVISSFAMKGALRYNEKWFESAYIFQESELLALIKCAHRLAHLVRISGDGFLRPELKLPVGQRFDLLLKEPEYVAWALQMGKTSKPAP